MEIDLRTVAEGERLSKVLAAVDGLGPDQVLTVLSTEDPAGLMESVRAVAGASVDIARIRWGLAELPWLCHLKVSRKAGPAK